MSVYLLLVFLFKGTITFHTVQQSQVCAIIWKTLLNFQQNSLGLHVQQLNVLSSIFQGAATGVIMGHLITLWITFGSLTVDKPTKILPLTIDGCTNETFSPHITGPESITPWTLPPNTYFDYGNDTDVSGTDNIDTILATPS